MGLIPLIPGLDPVAFPTHRRILWSRYEEINSRGGHAELHMFASAPHAFDADPLLSRQCADILATFFDRIFRPENYAFKIDPSVPGDAFIDMDGSVVKDANGPAKL